MRLRLDHGLVLLALLGLPSCGGGSSTPAAPPNPNPTTTTTPAPPAAAADLTITIAANAGASSYAPAGATVKVGQTVAWKNSDTDVHTATDNGGRFNTGTVAPGATSAPITMSTAGSFPYHCQFHPGMVATLTVNP